MPSKAVLFEKKQAQRDAKTGIDEYGELITFIFRSESTVTRDKYGSLKKITGSYDTTVSMKCYPIHDNPTQKQLEKAGLIETADTMITTAMLDWKNENIDLDDMDMVRMSVVLKGLTYKVKEKSHKYQMADDMLYVSFGLALE